MKKVRIEPGICGLLTVVEANSEDGMEIVLKVKSGCESVNRMMAELGDSFDAFALCLSKPGKNILYEYASENFPMHAACPVIAGIVKCAEVECNLALPCDAKILFE